MDKLIGYKMTAPMGITALPESNEPSDAVTNGEIFEEVEGEKKVKESLLLDDNLMNYFDTTTHEVVNGKITIKMSWLLSVIGENGVLPVPGAPTNGVVDDVNDTFEVTPPSGYSSAQLETSVNTGSTWSDNANLNDPFYIGDSNKVIGQVITRVKANSNVNQTGLGLANDEPFTASGGGDDLTPITEWNVVGGTATGNRLNPGFESAISTRKLLSGEEGYVRFDGAARVGFELTDVIFIAIYVNSYNGKVGVERKLGTNPGQQIADDGGFDFLNDIPCLRLRADADYFYPEASEDGGITWEQVYSEPEQIPRPTGDLTLVAHAGNNDVEDYAENIVGLNLII